MKPSGCKFILFNIFQPRNKVKVTIEQGTLQGQQYNTILSYKPYVSFLGVPYAKPPVGDLRFKVKFMIIIYLPGTYQ